MYATNACGGSVLPAKLRVGSFAFTALSSSTARSNPSLPLWLSSFFVLYALIHSASFLLVGFLDCNKQSSISPSSTNRCQSALRPATYVTVITTGMEAKRNQHNPKANKSKPCAPYLMLPLAPNVLAVLSNDPASLKASLKNS